MPLLPAEQVAEYTSPVGETFRQPDVVVPIVIAPILFISKYVPVEEPTENGDVPPVVLIES